MPRRTPSDEDSGEAQTSTIEHCNKRGNQHGSNIRDNNQGPYAPYTATAYLSIPFPCLSQRIICEARESTNRDAMVPRVVGHELHSRSFQSPSLETVSQLTEALSNRFPRGANPNTQFDMMYLSAAANGTHPSSIRTTEAPFNSRDERRQVRLPGSLPHVESGHTLVLQNSNTDHDQQQRNIDVGSIQSYARMHADAMNEIAMSGTLAMLYGGQGLAANQMPVLLAHRIRRQQELDLQKRVHFLEASAMLARRQISQCLGEANNRQHVQLHVDVPFRSPSTISDDNEKHDLQAAPSSVSTSALLSAAQAAERARPFSQHEEDQIPVIGGSETFPMVLHRALAELEFNGRHADIAEFLPDGRTFQIKNQTFFEETILPTFFPKMKCFASFQRQLNLYNFKRVGGKGLPGAYTDTSFHSR
ncbi:DNA binding protein [Fragilaria crotonensis]|nr:DNA binding protein [Fragilaria crotonensis]